MKNLIRIVFIFILLCSVSLAIYAQESRQGTGSISGRVTVNGRPGRGVVILVINDGKDKDDEPRSFADLLGRINRLTCDENGNFHLTNLDAGRYEVAAFAPSLVGVPKSTEATPPDDEKKPANEDDAEPTHNKSDEAASDARKITLEDGEKVDDVDFTFARGGVITGRVTYEDGSPAIGVVMQLNEMQGNKKTYRAMNMEFDSSSIKTDDRGIYRIYGLPDGRYKVSAAGRGGASMQVLSANRYRRRTFYPNVTDEASAGIIEVANGSEVRDIDIKFADPAKSYTVSGRVIAADTNRPVPNAPVNFTSQGEGNEMPPISNYAVSNSKGEFKFEGIPSGSYSVLSPRGSPDGNTPAGNGDYYSALTKFEVKDADVRGVTIRLLPGISIAGNIVVEGGDTGLLAQTPGLGLFAGVQPSGTETETNVIPGGSFADVNPDGSFLLRGLSPGRANFSIHSRGDNATRLQILRVEGSHVTDGRTVYLQKGDRLTDVRIIVAAANCTVKGQVTVQGTLPKNAQITVIARKPNTAKKTADDEDDDEEDGEATADANGNFEIKGLLAGQYEIVAEVVIGYSKEGKPIMREAKQMVSLSGGQEATVMLVIDLK